MVRRLRHLLDTDMCVDYLRDRHPTAALVGGSQVAAAISCVTLAELLHGATRSDQPVANTEAVAEFVSGVVVLSLDWHVARQFGELKTDLHHRGIPLANFDLLIAATARVHDLVLVTANTAHFERIPGLKLENWREREQRLDT